MTAIILKNLWLTLSDKKGLFIDLALPIILASIVGLTFSGSDGDNPTEIVVADEDGGKEAGALVEKLRQNKALKVEMLDEAAARDLVRQGKASVAVVIPKGTSERLAEAPFGDAQPELTILVDPSKQATAAMARGIVIETVMGAVGPQFASGDRGKSMLEKAIKGIDDDAEMTPARKARLKAFLEMGMKFFDLMPKAEEGEPDVGSRMAEPVKIKVEEVTGSHRKMNAFALSFPATAVMFALFAVMDAALMLVRERSRGTLARTIIAPIGKGAVLAGEAISIFLWITIQLTVMMAFGILVFKVPILGPWPALVAMILATAAVAAAFGMAIAAYGRTEKQVHGYAILIVLVMSAIGGSWFPLFMMPPWMQDVASFTITKWAVNGFEDITWRGLGYADVLPDVAVLVGITLALAVLSIRRFRWD